MSTPSASKKRKYTAPCHCRLCKGKERDSRTIVKHSLADPFVSCSSEVQTHEDADEDSGSSKDGEVGTMKGGARNTKESNEDAYSNFEANGHDDCDDRLSHNTMISHTLDPTELMKMRQLDTGLSPKILNFIMKELQLKLKYGTSRSEFEEHLKNARGLVEDNIPIRWGDVMKLLKTLGYSEPKWLKVCVKEDHSFVLSSCQEVCSFCKASWDMCIDYFVLGLGIDDWFISEEKCGSVMSHWEDRDTWLGDSTTSNSELWHGDRFKSLSWFWDPTQITLLPEKCEVCGKIITTDLIKKQLDVCNTQSSDDDIEVCVLCESCCSLLSFVPRYMKGDPRNQAIIIHEDGWAPHSTSSAHSIAAITISTACSNKLHRSSESNCRVYSFVPVNQLPSKTPHKYDGFFAPLVDEVENLFLHGKEVFFHSAVNDHSNAKSSFNVRVIPLLLTADMKAHAEVGLTSAGGLKGCRRCEVEGTYIPSKRHYYYGDYLTLYYNRPSPREAEISYRNGVEVENALTKTQRAELSKKYGVTGVSIFYRWYFICQFDPVNDLAIDVMHVVLNLVRSELELLITSCNVDGSHIVDRSKLACALRYVPWTSELKDGRLPSITSSSDPTHLGHWKTEEFVKFASVAPYVLHSITSSKLHYDTFYLLHRICQLLFSLNLRINGWQEEEVTLLERLLWLHAINFERCYGTEHCTENLKYSLHIPNDISRHSSPDNYWCFVFERLVRFYKQQSTNQRNLCKTYADRASLSRFIDCYLTLDNNSHPKEENNNDMFTSDISCHNDGILLAEATVTSAILLKEHIDNQSTLSAQASDAYDYGIAVGSLTFKPLSDREFADIQVILSTSSGHTNVNTTLPLTCRYFTKLVKADRCNLAVTYRIGETVIIKDSENAAKEWVMKISTFILWGPEQNRYHLFVDGTYYAAKPNEFDDWTGKEKMVLKNYKQFCVQPTTLIDRKVMLYPSPGNLNNPNYYLIIDGEEIDYALPIIPENEEI